MVTPHDVLYAESMKAAPPMPDSEAAAHAEAIARRSGSSFLLAMRLLDPVQRSAMFAIYAFCREVDDIADDPGDPAEKCRRLEFWRAEIGRLFAGEPRDLTARALVGPVVHYGLRQVDFLAVIDGMEMDAADRVRIADMDELHLYCDRVACAVGRLSVSVFGIDDGPGETLSAALGEALQLTNILRDLAEDAERDRLYLPADLLARHGIESDVPAEVLAHPALGAACAEIVALARRRYSEAEDAERDCGHAKVRAPILMREAYRRVLDRLERRGWRRLDEAVGLSPLEKAWILLRHGIG